MKRYPILLFLASALLGCGGHEPAKPGTDTIPSVTTPSFAKGADISWVSEMEKDGMTFRKKNGSEADIFEVLKETGVNSIRLRVWVDPFDGWSGKSDVLRLAGRAAKAGMAVMIDFHYSDFFADPNRQTIPSAWKADKDDLEKMAKRVSSHTTEVLNALKSVGVTPAWVQVGNETRNGMLWPTGQLWTDSRDIPDGRAHFARLLNAGYDAAKPATTPPSRCFPTLWSLPMWTMPMRTMHGGSSRSRRQAASSTPSPCRTILRRIINFLLPRPATSRQSARSRL